jgi:hypothetical protein
MAAGEETSNFVAAPRHRAACRLLMRRPAWERPGPPNCLASQTRSLRSSLTPLRQQRYTADSAFLQYHAADTANRLAAGEPECGGARQNLALRRAS